MPVSYCSCQVGCAESVLYYSYGGFFCKQNLRNLQIKHLRLSSKPFSRLCGFESGKYGQYFSAFENLPPVEKAHCLNS